eukprot:14434060-Alexandrium_andersonii.AAC.1
MPIKWSSLQSGRLLRSPALVEDNSRTFPEVIGWHVVFAPAAVAMATLLYLERRKPGTVDIDVRHGLLAAKAAAVLI